MISLKRIFKEGVMSKATTVLQVAGLPPLKFVRISDIDVTIEKIEMPDKTNHSSGRTNPGEFSGELMCHEKSEIGYMETWYVEGQYPVTPGYKKTATITFKGVDGVGRLSFVLEGVWISNRKLPDSDMTADDAQTIEYTLSFDDIYPAEAGLRAMDTAKSLAGIFT